MSATEASHRLRELLTRIANGERFVIQQSGQPEAVLMNLSELVRREGSVRAVQAAALALGQQPAIIAQIETGHLHPAMAAFGLWRDEDDLDNLAYEIAHNRQQSPARPAIT